MSFLSSVSTEPKVQGCVSVAYGPNGVGKTSLISAASLAKPLLVDLEEGANYIKVPKIKISTFPDLKKLFTELINESHPYTLIGLDTMDIVEHLATEEVCREHKAKSIEKVDGGFGKGYVYLREEIRSLMADIRSLANRGIDVFLLAHSQVKPHNDPVSQVPYDRYVMRSNDKVASIVKDLSDNVFFCTYKVFVTEGDNGRGKGIGGDERVMFTQYSAGYDAKNRQSLPVELPLSYDAYKKAALSQYAPSAEELQKEIKALIGTLKDPGLAEKVGVAFKNAGADIKELIGIKTRLQTLINK